MAHPGRWTRALALGALALAACGKRGDPAARPCAVTPQAVTEPAARPAGRPLEIALRAPRAPPTGGVAPAASSTSRSCARTSAGDFLKTAKRTRRGRARREPHRDLAPSRRRARPCAWPPGRWTAARVSACPSVALLVVQRCPPRRPTTSWPQLKGECRSPESGMGTDSQLRPPPSRFAQPVDSVAVRQRPEPPRARPLSPDAGAHRLRRRRSRRPVQPAAAAAPGPSGLASPRPRRPPRAVADAEAARADGLPASTAATEPRPLRPAAPLRAHHRRDAFDDKTGLAGPALVLRRARRSSPRSRSSESASFERGLPDRRATSSPPPRPAGVAALGPGRRLEVCVEPFPGADLVDYRVYRAAPARSRGSGSREVAPPEHGSLRDATAARRRRYSYTVTAIDRAGQRKQALRRARQPPGGRP